MSFDNFFVFLSSNDEKLHYGTIICSLGVRYKFYCSNIVRTMLYEPTEVSVATTVTDFFFHVKQQYTFGKSSFWLGVENCYFFLTFRNNKTTIICC